MVRDKEERIEFFGVTTQYKSKSEQIKKVYFPILEWESAGLMEQSWIDVGTVRALTKDRENITYKTVGKLTENDMKRLNDFIAKLKHK